MSHATESPQQSRSLKTGRLRSLAVILASLIIPAPVLTGRIVEAIMDTANPAGLDDVTAGLAYLTEILGWSLAILAVVVVGFLVTTILVFVREKSFRAISLPVTVAVIQVAIGIAALAANGAIDRAAGG